MLKNVGQPTSTSAAFLTLQEKCVKRISGPSAQDIVTDDPARRECPNF